MRILILIFFCFTLTIECKSQIIVEKENCPEISYSDLFSMFSQYKIQSYYDYDEGLLCSKISDKPYLVYFCEIGSVYSRKFEVAILSDSVIFNLLKTKFIITTLYTDVRSILTNNKTVICQFTGDTIWNYDEKQRYIQVLKFKENKSPALYIINSKEQILAGPYYSTSNTVAFKDFLNMGIETYSKNVENK